MFLKDKLEARVPVEAEKNGWNFIVFCFKMTFHPKKLFLSYILNLKINRRFYG